MPETIACGKVTAEERDEIKKLYQRKTALLEMLPILAKMPDVDALYERIVADLGCTAVYFQEWWQRKAAQYGWQAVAGGNWSVNFDTCDVTLVR